jgi:hypothetical protein
MNGYTGAAEMKLRVLAALALVITVAILIACLYFRTERGFRIAGGAFEFLGVVCVFVGIYRTLKRLRIGLREIADKVGIPFPSKPRSADLNLNIQEAPDIVTAQGKVGVGLWHTLEERVAVLEERLDQARAEASEAVRRETNARIAAIEAEQRARQESDAGTLAAADKEVRSNLPLETIGAVWIALGIVITTLAEELEHLLHG